ncbi:Putative HC-toxin efflux carrier TOXA [Talaromyces islandicus]|uniref:Putative HC-toxin efflux carrier TOXA n=1 Tax=Talaromyces islandicus TaxID=28573 RepID=A0A0U1LTY1_TALIS|nr:Putative HC-toxin efflux carrier TOXA [Talaromyces islandicus]
MDPEKNDTPTDISKENDIQSDSKPIADHVETPDSENGTRMTANRFLSLTAMAFLWTGSQIPIYLFGGIPPYIYGDIGGADRWVWFVLANLLALAGVCPFVGSLSDLFGRRYVAILGSLLVCIGIVVSSTAKNMNVFIGGMAIAGAGAGINELTALAATAEMAPARKRGTYVAALVFTIFPWAAAVLWAQLVAYHANWRYVGALAGIWNGLGLLCTLFFYFPPPRVNDEGLSRGEILSRVDYVGGFLSITGLILFLAGLQWGGYQYPWTTAHVLVPLILGFLILVAFGFWEAYGAKYPMIPAKIIKEPRTLGLTLLITWVSGANFFSIILFWPTQSFNEYGHDPVAVGVRSLPVGYGILAGACITLWLLSLLKGRNKELMIGSSVLMTAGCGAMAVARTDNLSTLWFILIIASLGIGGIVVPASIMTTIICPDDLIATIAALTLSIRVAGGAIGYTIYYNVFINKFIPKATYYIGGTMSMKLGITNTTYITEAIELTGASLLTEMQKIPGIAGNTTAYEMVVAAGQLAYAESYKYVYLTSIVFGVLSIAASLFLGDITKYMDDHVAVVYH